MNAAIKIGFMYCVIVLYVTPSNGSVRAARRMWQEARTRPRIDGDVHVAGPDIVKRHATAGVRELPRIPRIVYAAPWSEA
jgi:hypothetical protein